MPIFDQSYRAYTGTHTGRASRLLAITLAGMKPPLKKRLFLILLLVSSVVFLFQFARLYLADYAGAIGLPTRFGPGMSLAPESTGGQYFLEFLLNQENFLFIITLYVGAGLISDDLASGALPLYLSRPIGKLDYILGKLLSMVGWGALVTAVPAFLLWLLLASKAMGSGDAPPLSVGLGTMTFAAGLLLGFSLVMLAISSLTKSRRGAGFTFAIFYIVSAVFAQILGKILHTPFSRLLNFPELFEGLGRLVLGVPDPDVAWLPAAQSSVLLGWILLSLLILAFRVRQGSSA